MKNFNILPFSDESYNPLMKRDGKAFMSYFGGGGSKVETPAAVSPTATLTEDEKARQTRYGKDLAPFEELYNATPEYYKTYAEDIKNLYPERRERTSSLEDQIYNMLPNVNTLSPEFQQQTQQNYDIRKEQGLKSLNELYNPLEQKITGRAFQNFGGLENSAYNDLENKLMEQRGSTVNDFINQLQLQKQQEEATQLGLQGQNLQNLMSGYNMYNTGTQEYPAALGSAAELGKGGTALYNDLINAISNKGLQGAMLQNQFNLSNYQNLLGQQQQQQQNRNSMIGAGISGLGALI